MKKLFCLLIAAVLFISCSSTYKYDYDNPIDDVLEQNTDIAITVSEDGFYGDDIYTGSGKILSNVVKQELKPYTAKATVLKNKESLDEITNEELEKYDYIVIPEILHWEDRATAWSGRPDKVKVSIEIYNSKKELLKSAVLEGKSASMTLASNDPSELLEKPLSIFFKSVFVK